MPWMAFVLRVIRLVSQTYKSSRLALNHNRPCASGQAETNEFRGKLKVFHRAVMPAVESAAESSDPDIAVGVLADRGDGGILQGGGGSEDLELFFAQTHQAAPVQAHPDIAFAVLKPAVDEVAGQAVGG